MILARLRRRSLPIFSLSIFLSLYFHTLAETLLFFLLFFLGREGSPSSLSILPTTLICSQSSLWCSEMPSSPPLPLYRQRRGYSRYKPYLAPLMANLSRDLTPSSSPILFGHQAISRVFQHPPETPGMPTHSPTAPIARALLKKS